LTGDFDDEATHPGHHSIRLKGYDYASEGLYFITICSDEGRCVFGRIVDSSAVLSPAGLIVRECWVAIPLHFGRTRLHEFVIMPNHLHGIVEIFAELGRSSAAPLRGSNAASVTAGSLGVIVRSFKAAATKLIRERLNRSGPVWQRNYFERVIRDGEEFADATRYILENPVRWEWDRENPQRKPLPVPRAPIR
jgi:REP element-mobilizing transposase RayT